MIPKSCKSYLQHICFLLEMFYVNASHLYIHRCVYKNGKIYIFFSHRAFWLTLLQMSFYLNGFIFINPFQDLKNSSLTLFQSSASNYKITHTGLSIMDMQNLSLHEIYRYVVIMRKGTVCDAFHSRHNNPSTTVFMT